jgi:hypothetical protein
MRGTTRRLTPALFVCVSGCAAQLDGVMQNALDPWCASYGARVEAHAVFGRPRAFTLGAQMTVGTLRDGLPLRAHSGGFSAGLLARPRVPLLGGAFVRSLGYELAGVAEYGGPADQRFVGAGFYGGLRARGFMRVYGAPPHRRAARIVWIAVDLGATADLGVWTPPSSIPDPVPFGYASFAVGVRVTALSDILSDTISEDPR